MGRHQGQAYLWRHWCSSSNGNLISTIIENETPRSATASGLSTLGPHPSAAGPFFPMVAPNPARVLFKPGLSMV